MREKALSAAAQPKAGVMRGNTNNGTVAQ